MKELLINLSYGNWYAFISNSPVSYRFAGADSTLQSVQVRAFQEAMKQGEQTVVNNIQNFFSDIYQGDEQKIFDQLFRGSKILKYSEQPDEFTTDDGNDLSDELLDAGEWLGEALG